MIESATIEETVTRLVADVDWTDECEVLLHLRKRTSRLTPAQARLIAEALSRAAEAAERAAAKAVRVVEPAGFDLAAAVTVYCPSKSSDGDLCTRPMGHDGIHAAQTEPNAVPYVAWGGAA